MSDQTENDTLSQVDLWDDKVRDSKQRLDEYVKLVNGLKSELNFLVLGKAFTSFIKEKTNEKRRQLCFLICIGAVIFAIPLCIFAYNMQNPRIVYSVRTQSDKEILTGISTEAEVVDNATSNESASENAISSPLLLLIPLTIAEIVLIFYFRIILNYFNSTCAQLLQLKMRHSVCQFIESYIEFKKEVGEPDLERFEAFIFSNLAPNADQIPTTFEGAEQIVEAIKALKRK